MKSLITPPDAATAAVNRRDGTAVAAQRRAPTAAPLLLLACLLLGQAIISGQHGFSAVALWCVGGAIVLQVAALLLRRASSAARITSNVLLLVGIAIDFYRLPLIDLYLRFPPLREHLQPFCTFACFAAAAAAVIALGRPRAFVPLAFPLLLVIVGGMGVWYLHLTANPHDDTYLFHRMGCNALLHGQNPYTLTFPDVYGPAAHYYPPGLVVGGRVQSGYPYPPLTLLLDLPAQWLTGDVRYAHLAELLLAAGVLAIGIGPRQRRLNFRIATLLLLFPGTFHLLENGWTEPMLVLLVVLAAAAAERRRPWWGAALVGLAVCAKQYMPLALPAMLLLAPRPWGGRQFWRWIAVAAAAGAASVLPFLLWNPRAFLHSQFAMNVGMVRADSISFVPLLARAWGIHANIASAAVAAAAAGVLVLWRAPRTAGGFAVGLSLILTCAFAFSPIAFGNYYSLAAGALCMGLLGLTATRGDSPDAP